MKIDTDKIRDFLSAHSQDSLSEYGPITLLERLGLTPLIDTGYQIQVGTLVVMEPYHEAIAVLINNSWYLLDVVAFNRWSDEPFYTGSQPTTKDIERVYGVKIRGVAAKPLVRGSTSLNSHASDLDTYISLRTN